MKEARCTQGALVGGNYANGLSVGPVCANMNNAFSNSNANVAASLSRPVSRGAKLCARRWRNAEICPLQPRPVARSGRTPRRVQGAAA